MWIASFCCARPAAAFAPLVTLFVLWMDIKRKHIFVGHNVFENFREYVLQTFYEALFEKCFDTFCEQIFKTSTKTISKTFSIWFQRVFSKKINEIVFEKF